MATVISRPADLKVGEVLYRATATVTSMGVDVSYEEWEVVKVTPAGARLCVAGARAGSYTIWRSFPGRFAFRTKKEALASLKARTRARVGHAAVELLNAIRVTKDLGMTFEALPAAESAAQALVREKWGYGDLGLD